MQYLSILLGGRLQNLAQNKYFGMNIVEHFLNMKLKFLNYLKLYSASLFRIIEALLKLNRFMECSFKHRMT